MIRLPQFSRHLTVVFFNLILIFTYIEIVPIALALITSLCSKKMV